MPKFLAPYLDNITEINAKNPRSFTDMAYMKYSFRPGKRTPSTLPQLFEDVFNRNLVQQPTEKEVRRYRVLEKGEDPEERERRLAIARCFDSEFYARTPKPEKMEPKAEKKVELPPKILEQRIKTALKYHCSDLPYPFWPDEKKESSASKPEEKPPVQSPSRGRGKRRRLLRSPVQPPGAMKCSSPSKP